MNYRGKHVDRLDRNPLERAFHDAWVRANTNGQNTLEWLMGDGMHRADDITERDYLVAATIIQWLGSSVGESFVDDVMQAYRTGQKRRTA